MLEIYRSAEEGAITLKAEEFSNCKVVYDFKKFSEKSDVILANRIDDILKDVKEKVYTRDLYSRD